MLPDFPQVKSAVADKIEGSLRQAVRRSPVLGGIKTEHHFEGKGFSIEHIDGDTEVSEYEEFGHRFEINRRELIQQGPHLYFNRITELATAITAKQSQAFYNKVTEACEVAGTALDAHGRPLSFELFLELLEKLQIDFDEDGQPQMPTVIVSPSMFEVAKKMIPQWTADPECERRFTDLIERKRIEWYARESHRKLVD